MDIKLGTQTWSSKPDPGIRHSDNIHTNSAQDEAKALQNGEDLGDTLNKVADANWVDPAKKLRTTGNNELGKDAFMNLLLTQMKNQDPTNPLKSHEMAAQLAQFTSLEKLTNIDAGIEKMRTENKPDKNFEALSLIGKAVTTDSTKISRGDLTSNHDLRFRLSADASKTSITIKDAKGNIVRSLVFNNLKAGKNNVTWNGQLEDGSAAPVGDYTMEVEARSSNGARVLAQAKTEGVITGINFTAHGPQVLIGKDAIDISDIKSIVEPSPSQEPQPAPNGPFTSPPLMTQAVPGAASGVIPTAAQATPPIAAQQMPAATAVSAPMAMPPMPVMPQGAPPALAQAPRPAHRMMSVKPENKPGGLKRSKLQQGNIMDATMATSVLNQLKKQGAVGT